MAGHLREALWAAPIYPLIGASISRYDVLPGIITGQVTTGGKDYAWVRGLTFWSLTKAPGILANYSDQFYAGKAAAVTHKLGKGTVTYIGVDTLNGRTGTLVGISGLRGSRHQTRQSCAKLYCRLARWLLGGD